MPMAAKVLGQVSLTANAETTLYTAPANTAAMVQSLILCSVSTSLSTTFRVMVRLSGEASTNTKNFLVYDQNIDPRETVILTLGITLGAGDSLRVLAGSSSVAATAFGVERS